MRLESFTTKNDETVNLGDFTVLVGPNNTGKSQTLLDIHSIMSTGSNNPLETTIVNEVEYEPATFSEFFDDLTITEHPNLANQRIIRGIDPSLQSVAQQNIQHQQYHRLEGNEEITDSGQFEDLAKFKVALLDASSRLAIAESTDTYNLSDGHPTSVLQKLYTAPEARERLRDAFRNTFDKDILLDFSSLREFILRVDHDFGENEDNLLGPPDDHSDFAKIDDQGAGFKSFAGVVLSLLLTENRVVLLDEPEAFLHPAQARQFGSWMASHASEIPGQLIISTHNSHFLTGILSASEGIAIHRLNRDGGHTKYNTMPSSATEELASDPLLSNQRVIEGVFHRGVVVCEADGDALIYRVASEEELDERDLLFTHAHNKQTIGRVTDVLSGASIPRAAVVDIDILRHPSDYGQLLQSLNSGEQEFRDATNTCNHFNQELEETEVDWGDIKDGGRQEIPDVAEENFEELYEIGRDNGLFIVDVGELEGWMDLDTSKGPNWVIEALDKIDGGECSSELVDFVSEIQRYLTQQYSELVVAESG